MAGFTFQDWLKQSGNQQFWYKPVASEYLDNILTNKDIQKSIAKSKTNQTLYSYLEHRIVADYAHLIDSKLREVFKKINIGEFQDPSGFESKHKSTHNQYHYFELRNQLELFLKQDIQQHHDAPDAELNAFRRWIEISDMLLRRHCYEGFLLIFINLQLISRPNLINGLPGEMQKNYHELCKLSSPDKNHQALRHFINNNKSDRDFSPLIFTYHAIAMLNESIVHIREHLILLKCRRKNVAKEITQLQKEVDPEVLKEISNLIEQHKRLPKGLRKENTHLIELMRENRKLLRELKRNHKIMSQEIQQRSDLLNLIKREQSSEVKPIPEHLEKTYNRIYFRYSKYKVQQHLNILPAVPSTDRNATPPAQLYSHHLLPSFWQRKGNSPETYWKEVFTPSCLYKK